MKVLQRCCPHCGFMLLFSVEILSRPNTAKNPGSRCPCCETRLGQDGALTELDIDEVPPKLDFELIRGIMPAE